MNKTRFLALISFLLISPFISTAQIGSFGGFPSHTSYYNHGITYAKAKERGDNLKPWWRQDIGFYFPFSSATFTHVYQTFDNNTGDLLKSITNTNTVTLKSGIGITEGTFFPLITMKDKSMLAIGYQANCYVAKFNIGPEQLGGSTTYAGTCDIIECGLAFSLDYKFGADAELNSNKKTGITFGAGYYPNYVFAAIKHDFASQNVAFDPFVKVEFSFYMGVCFKLKAMTIFRTSYYLQSYESDVIPSSSSSIDYNAVSITGSPTYSLSLVVLPYSYDWGND